MVKKRIAKIAAIIMVIILSILSLSACNFIKENKTRVANQELITINGANGIKMTLTQNEILDYYNTYAYYLINNYGYSVEAALDFAVESKIKNKYLITIAMGYLTKDVPARKGVLVGGGKMNTVEDVLTYAEYYAAIKSVNESLESSIESFIEESYQEALTSKVSRINKQNVEKIEFAPSTLEYLKDEYLVNQDIDKEKIKIRIVYDPAEEGGENTYSEEFIVPDSMYDTEFSSAEEGKDKSFSISLEEKIVDGNETTYETHTITHTFDVVKPRATKTEPEEQLMDDIKIGDITVNRYATPAELEAAGAVVQKIDVYAEYNRLKNDPTADSDKRDAYRRLTENLTKGGKTVYYIYNSAFESAVVSALQSEVQKTALRTGDNAWDAEVLAEFKYKYQNAKDGYANLTKEEKIDEKFGTAIKSNLDEYYYHPELDNLSDYIYVSQILFNFTEEQKAFLKEYAGDDENVSKEYYEHIFRNLLTTRASNPDYDADYDCPLHEKGDADAPCKWETEKEEGEEGICPSIPYLNDGEQQSVIEIYTEIQNKLEAIYDNGALTPEAKSKEAYELFEKYMYTYNDDPGAMNPKTGYLIAPEGVKDPNGFYQAFLDLAYDVYDYSAAVGNAFTADSKLGYAFTEYGVHLIMISMTPFANAEDGAELSFEDDAEMLNFIKNTVIDLSGDTIYDVLQKKVIEDHKSQAYTNFTNERIKNDLQDDEDIVVKNEKKLKKLYEDYVGKK